MVYLKEFITPGLAQYLYPNPGTEEAIDQPLYHIQAYAAAGFTSLSFFGTTQGAAAGSVRDTNLDIAGTLPKPKRYVVFAIEVSYLPALAVGPMIQSATAAAAPSFVQDTYAVLQGGALRFTVIDKTYYLSAPLMRTPAGYGLSGFAAVKQEVVAAATNSVNVTYASNGAPLAAAARFLYVPIPIPSQVSFGVEITYTAAAAVSVASRIGVTLNGLLIRPVQ